MALLLLFVRIYLVSILFRQSIAFISSHIIEPSWRQKSRTLDSAVFRDNLKRQTIRRVVSCNTRNNDASIFTVSNDDEGCNDENRMGKTFVLPIFPLRKRVRFPTDVLTLNLYEERYLAMCDYLLHKITDNTMLTVDDDVSSSMSPSSSQQHRQAQLPYLFGAMYTSNKPQIVSQSTGPIVPILSTGDVGTIFVVVEYADINQNRFGGNRNGSSESKISQQDPRRKIRLDAVGISRFRVERVICDGTGTVSKHNIQPSTEGDGSSSLRQYVPKAPTPFILVEASVIFDNDESVNLNEDTISSLEQTIDRIIDLNTVDVFKKIGWKLRNNPSTSTSTSTTSNTPQSPVESLNDELTAKQFIDSLYPLLNAVAFHGEYIYSTEEHYRWEMTSFLASSLWMNGYVSNSDSKPTSDMISLLRSRSTNKRSKWIKNMYINQ